MYGWRGGAELTTRDGVVCVTYEAGNDRIDGVYHTIGAYLNVGFRLDGLLAGESPFSLPEPVFKSPRNLRRLLTRKARRNWHMPRAVVALASLAGARGPYFVADIQGPYSGCANGSYTQQSETEGTWLLEGPSSGPNPKASSWTVTLEGDTSTVPFPITVSISSTAVPPVAFIGVAGGGAGVTSVTRVLSGPGDVITIAPFGSNKPRVNISAANFDVLGTGTLLGTIFVSGGNVPTLVISARKL